MAENTTEDPKGQAAPKDLTTKAETPVATRPVNRIAGKGFENLEREDILLPRVKLLQPLSPEVVEDDMKPGNMFLTLSNKDLGEKIIFTPILHFRSRIKWIPKDSGGGMECSSPDGRMPRENKFAPNCSVCAQKEWNENAPTKKEKQPKCTLIENFVILVGDGTEPAILTMDRTKSGIAKKFYSAMAVKGGDMFFHSYEISTKKEKNDDGQTYYNYTVRDIGQPTSEERRQFCNGLWETLHQKDLSKGETAPEEAAAEQTAAGGSKY